MYPRLQVAPARYVKFEQVMLRIVQKHSDIMRVCQYWKLAMERYLALWTRIYLRKGSKEELTGLHTWLNRSGTLLLDINISYFNLPKEAAWNEMSSSATHFPIYPMGPPGGLITYV
ncbi:hypothetical protein M422DRAFT_47191 [Sphaerobolus stellatus SS14]|uniref:Uncharacterized protein n=1 Tax=Sphaerobolus stellatus (strain SS14) TaxID=990650 RepID=A0A0C9VCX6_SPHS4|nr:hypothetical protein M422DRAFT_47191 [Sphaerobolus stellatus SS14]